MLWRLLNGIHELHCSIYVKEKKFFCLNFKVTITWKRGFPRAIFSNENLSPLPTLSYTITKNPKTLFAAQNSLRILNLLRVLSDRVLFRFLSDGFLFRIFRDRVLFRFLSESVFFRLLIDRVFIRFLIDRVFLRVLNDRILFESPSQLAKLCCNGVIIT